MKKLILATAIVAAGAAGYWYTQQGDSNTDLLNFVPADTALLSVQTKPFPIKNYIDSVSSSYLQANQDSLDMLDLDDENVPSIKFLVSLFKTYNASLKDGSTFVETFGLPDNVRSYFYMLGALPVFKLDVAKPEAIWKVLDQAEADSGVIHEKRTLKGLEYRVYNLSQDDPTADVQIELVVAANDGVLTMMLNASIAEPQLLEMALGLTPVESSLASTDTVNKLIREHGFRDEGISLINHVEIIKALTSTDGNLLAKHLQKMFEIAGEDPLAELKTAECKKDFTSIGANWPRTVMGIDSLTISKTATNMDLRTIVESKNAVIMGALQSMRGFIPTYTNNLNDMVATLGLGVNVNKLVPAVTSVWEDLLTPEYQCAPLAAMQAQISSQSPGMIGMATGMANGVQGISASVLDYKLVEHAGMPELESLDAIVTLSAENPAMLFNMVKPFVPQLGHIQIPTDGSPIDLSGILPIPPQFGIKPKLAVKGQHMVLFSGDKSSALADALSTEPLSQNGIYTMAVDYKKALSPMFKLIEMSGEPVPAELEQLKHLDMRVATALDVTEKGILINFSMKTDGKTN